MRKREKILEPRSRALKLWDDTTSEERYYTRSIKIRMVTLEFMKDLADLAEAGKPVPLETMEDLADYAVNYVESSGWDRKPASSVTTRRWARTYIRGNSHFKTQPYGSGSFLVSWMGGEPTKERVNRILLEFRRKK